jgi:hypothetical protein
MIDQPVDDELTKKFKTAKRLFQDYRYKVVSGDPEQASYNTEQANFWLGKYRTLKEELNQRNNPDKPTGI